jgi:hypothetical protein
MLPVFAIWLQVAMVAAVTLWACSRKAKAQ